MAVMRANVPAAGFSDVVVDLAIGVVLFVVVIAVTAVLMFILQAVLPRGDTGADALYNADEAAPLPDEEHAEEAKRNAASGR